MSNKDHFVNALIHLCSIEGDYKAVADKAKVSPDNLWQIIHEIKLPSGNARGVGPSTRKKLSAAYPGWSELDFNENNTEGNQKNRPDELEIPQFNTGGSMGRGLLLRDQPGVIKSWTVNSEWVQKNVPSNSGAANLCIVTGFGPSMRPLFNPGDPLLVDRGINRYEGDAIYFFRVGEEGFIKSLQSIPGDGLRVISANREHFDTWTIKPDMDFEIYGRVLKVWKSEDF